MCCSEVIARTQVRTVIVTAVGDLLGAPKSWIVNYVVRHRAQTGAAVAYRRRHEISGQCLRAGRTLALAPVKLDHEDLAFLQYTGGTTGVVKGRDAHARQHRGECRAGAGVDRPRFSGASRPSLITPLPLYHIFALTANCLLFVLLGWKNVLITNPRDFPAFVAELKKHRFAFITGVNTLFNALLNTPGFEDVDFSELRITLGGGMAVQAAVAERWKQCHR